MEHAIKSAVERAGGVTALATKVGVTTPAISHCLSGLRKVPPERCPSIEHASGVPVEALRPDIRWVRVPDPDWPNPAGRPCHDYAGPVPADGAPPTAGLPAAHQVPHAAAAP